MGPVDICNIALITLGQSTITSLTDGSTEANICNVMYEPMRNEMIRSHPWRRLKKRLEIAASVTAPAFVYTYAFPLPADCVRLIDVWAGDYKLEEWELESTGIVCDESGPLQIRYIRDSDDPGEWDYTMRTAFAYRLGLAIAHKLTQDPVVVQSVARLMDEIEGRARKENAQEGLPVKLGKPDPWDQVRYGGNVYRGISEP